MPETKNHPPIIILGMHRSGTSMVVSLLREIGFFAGHKLDENLESRFFQRRNQWIMKRAGGSWDYPLPVKKLCQEVSLKEEAINLFKLSVSSRQFYAFTGSKSNLLFNKRTELHSPWGWKDPRTIFTFDLWLPVFPSAKIIYITRNGVDVAKSLSSRERQLITNGKRSVIIKPVALRLKGALHPFESHTSNSTRCTSLTESFKLWEEYNNECLNVYESFSGDKLFVRYEDILEKPDIHLREIAAFCGLHFKNDKLDKLSSKINSDRSYAFVHDEFLSGFYNKLKHNKIMQRLGYDKII
jgi:hypothetical protein